MIVVIANDLPDAVRGKMKLWFVEPRPNVFVSGVRDFLARQVVDFIYEYCTDKSGIIIFCSIADPPFFQIVTRGMPQKTISSISGMQLVADLFSNANNQAGNAKKIHKDF